MDKVPIGLFFTPITIIPVIHGLNYIFIWPVWVACMGMIVYGVNF